jgi:uncharacterized membrane protein YidH (DUF202 family)
MSAEDLTPGGDDDPDDGLAPERTSLAWQRTGLTHVATGAACLRLLPPSPYRLVLSVAMIVLGTAISVGGRRLHADRPHRRSIAAVGVATTLAALTAGALSL